MDEELYKELTYKEKLGLLHYIRGQQGLVQHWHYETLTNNPTLPVRPQDIYISNVLGIDFRYFYDNENWDKSKKYKKEMAEVSLALGDSPSVFVPDAIADVLYLKLDIDINTKLDEDLMQDIDNTLLKIYNTYITLGLETEYVPSGIISNGEELYKKVVKEA